MNGPHDMGGQHCFGPVRPEPNEPVFHTEWERRAFALSLAIAPVGGWTLDMSRLVRESLPPVEYLSKSYYEIWFTALEKLMLERALISADEIEAGHALHPPRPISRKLVAEDVAKVLYRGGPTEREASGPARFKLGDRVRAKNMHPRTHTRLPRYVRGHVGEIVLVHGCHVFPDSNATSAGEDPKWLYTVRFEASELWGPDGDPTSTISVDLWEPYLEPI